MELTPVPAPRIARRRWLRRPAGRFIIGLAIALIASLSLNGPGAGAARAAVHNATSFSVHGELNGVAAVTPDEAWAVGYSGVLDYNAKTLIVRWNGRTWSVVAAPTPVYGILWAVTATSPDNAWAVGAATARNGSAPRPLVLHWNGHTWRRDTTVPAVSGTLNGLTVSGSSVWAVGGTARKGGVSGPSLILHRTGGRWYVVPAPVPGHSGLAGVVLTKHGVAWAFGFGGNTLVVSDFLLRWNGTVWKPASFPTQDSSSTLYGMAAGPAGTAWAVGFEDPTVAAQPVALRWNGTAWRSVPVNQLDGQSEFIGVGTIPGGTAWAVGSLQLGPIPGIQPDGIRGLDGEQPGRELFEGAAFIAHWSGSEWSPVTTPTPGQLAELNAVAATSTANAWAVGSYVPSGQENPKSFIEHWNGKAWAD